MARTTQQIIEDLLGKKDMQIAALTAALEDAQERNEALQKALDEYVKQEITAQNPPPLKAVRQMKDDGELVRIKESNG